MAENSNGASPEHVDEAELLRRFEEKKRLLEAAGLRTETKEVFREAFREHVAEKIAAAPVAPPAPPPATPPPPSGPTTPVDTAVEGELKSLVSLALEKSILDAVKKAEAQTPYLIDALHDELADHYYDKLIQSGQLKPE